MRSLRLDPRAAGGVVRTAMGAAVVALVCACGGPDASPEARIKRLVADFEAAAEDRDIDVFKEHIADGYQDQRGYDRRTVLRLVQGLLLRNQRIHLLTLVRELEVADADARAVVLAAMAGSPIESTEALVNLNADLMRFEVALMREDDVWRVHTVDWRRSALDDFL